MVLLVTRDPKILTINIIVFGLIGIIYFFFYSMGRLEESLFHPLVYGWFGIWFSIVGGLSVLQFYRYRQVTLYKNSLYSVFYSMIYFMGFFTLPLMVNQTDTESIQLIWLGVLLVSYFITFGALNWYFGTYIALFNILILILSLLDSSSVLTEPLIWVHLFSFMGIPNIYVQWGLVILTTSLALLEKGFSMFKLFE